MISRFPLDATSTPAWLAAMQGSFFLLAGVGSLLRRTTSAPTVHWQWLGAPMILAGLALVAGPGTGSADRLVLGLGSAVVFFLILARISSPRSRVRWMAFPLLAFQFLWILTLLP